MTKTALTCTQFCVSPRFAQFRAALLAWWERSSRDFPWRRTRNPYHILIAETLLHRTRAAQVAPLYELTLRTYPSIQALAAAERADVHALLHSAGLRWRVDRLMEGAKYVVERFAGEVPGNRIDLEGIPGVGHYIAAAVRCFAFGQADAIIDSNVVRVYARMFKIPVTDRLRRDQEFHRFAQALVDPTHPREYNLALLDLAAAICVPRNPKCEQCPIASYCAYGCRVLGLNPPPSDLPRTQAGVPILPTE